MEDNVYPGLGEALAEHLKRKIVSIKSEPSDASTQQSEVARQDGAHDHETLPMSR